MLITFDNSFVEDEVKDTLREAGEFFIKHLVQSHIADELIVDVEISPFFECMGEILNEDIDADEVPPRFFTIRIRDEEDVSRMVDVFAHELVHVKQWALGELKDGIIMKHGKAVGVTMWNGVPWIAKEGEDYSYDSPWEIEAYGREVGLIKRWCDMKGEEYVRSM